MLLLLLLLLLFLRYLGLFREATVPPLIRNRLRSAKRLFATSTVAAAATSTTVTQHSFQSSDIACIKLYNGKMRYSYANTRKKALATLNEHSLLKIKFGLRRGVFIFTRLLKERWWCILRFNLLFTF